MWFVFRFQHYTWVDNQYKIIWDVAVMQIAAARDCATFRWKCVKKSKKKEKPRTMKLPMSWLRRYVCGKQTIDTTFDWFEISVLAGGKRAAVGLIELWSKKYSSSCLRRVERINGHEYYIKRQERNPLDRITHKLGTGLFKPIHWNTQMGCSFFSQQFRLIGFL